MSLDRRMADEARMKAKAVKVARSLGINSEDDPRGVGRLYSTHGKDCSCAMCGNPRKYFNEKTIGEKREDEKDAIDE